METNRNGYSLLQAIYARAYPTGCRIAPITQKIIFHDNSQLEPFINDAFQVHYRQHLISRPFTLLFLALTVIFASFCLPIYLVPEEYLSRVTILLFFTPIALIVMLIVEIRFKRLVPELFCSFFYAFGLITIYVTGLHPYGILAGGLSMLLPVLYGYLLPRGAVMHVCCSLLVVSIAIYIAHFDVVGFTILVLCIVSSVICLVTNYYDGAILRHLFVHRLGAVICHDRVLALQHHKKWVKHHSLILSPKTMDITGPIIGLHYRLSGNSEEDIDRAEKFAKLLAVIDSMLSDNDCSLLAMHSNFAYIVPSLTTPLSHDKANQLPYTFVAVTTSIGLIVNRYFRTLAPDLDLGLTYGPFFLGMHQGFHMIIGEAITNLTTLLTKHKDRFRLLIDSDVISKLPSFAQNAFPLWTHDEPVSLKTPELQPLATRLGVDMPHRSQLFRTYTQTNVSSLLSTELTVYDAIKMLLASEKRLFYRSPLFILTMMLTITVIFFISRADLFLRFIVGGDYIASTLNIAIIAYILFFGLLILWPLRKKFISVFSSVFLLIFGLIVILNLILVSSKEFRFGIVLYMPLLFLTDISITIVLIIVIGSIITLLAGTPMILLAMIALLPRVYHLVIRRSALSEAVQVHLAGDEACTMLVSQLSASPVLKTIHEWIRRLGVPHLAISPRRVVIFSLPQKIRLVIALRTRSPITREPSTIYNHAMSLNMMFTTRIFEQCSELCPLYLSQTPVTPHTSLLQLSIPLFCGEHCEKALFDIIFGIAAIISKLEQIDLIEHLSAGAFVAPAKIALSDHITMHMIAIGESLLFTLFDEVLKHNSMFLIESERAIQLGFDPRSSETIELKETSFHRFPLSQFLQFPIAPPPLALLSSPSPITVLPSSQKQ